MTVYPTEYTHPSAPPTGNPGLHIRASICRPNLHIYDLVVDDETKGSAEDERPVCVVVPRQGLVGHGAPDGGIHVICKF